MRIDSKDAASTIPLKSVESKPVEVSKASTASTTGTAGMKSTDDKLISTAHLSEFEKLSLPISEKVVLDAIEKANNAICGANRRFEISVHSKTKEIMIKVINSDTNEVIREIPPEKVLDAVATMWEMAGILVDERR